LKTFLFNLAEYSISKLLISSLIIRDMSTITWRRCISKAATEFPLTKLQVLEGKIPTSLHGSLYRNGPARLERGGQPIEHWFDGDGAVLGVHFDNGEARAIYKYIQSEWLKKEETANKWLYTGFGQKMSGGIWNRIFAKEARNAGNTSVLPLPDKVLALWEGGWPFAMDLENLDTLELDNLGFLRQGETFSAHPKVDFETGEIFSIGSTVEKGKSYLCVYKCDRNGKLITQTRLPHKVKMIHDFVIAGKYIVILSFPTEMTPKGIFSYVLGLKSYNDAVEWRPENGTGVFILNRNDLSLLNKFTTDPFYAYHYTNGYEEKDGTIYLELVKYDSYENIRKYHDTISHLNKPLPSKYAGRLSYMKIDPKKGTVIEMKDISDDCFEFPTVATEQVGKRWRSSLFAHNPKSLKFDDMIFRGIARYDYSTQNMHTYSFGEDRYASEPLLVSSKDPEEGHILTVVYDASKNQSELCIHESKNLEKDPVCRLLLPEVIPYGFHGKWQHSS